MVTEQEVDSVGHLIARVGVLLLPVGISALLVPEIVSSAVRIDVQVARQLARWVSIGAGGMLLLGVGLILSDLGADTRIKT